MIILGIDPGSTRIGYGVIESSPKLRYLDCGIIELKRSSNTNLIKELSIKLDEILDNYQPDIVGVEKIYFSKNVKTGIEVAQARGAILLTIAQKNIEVKEYSPSEIKSTVTNYGLSDKKAVAKMVMKFLNIEKLDCLDDVSDALAIAITTANIATSVLSQGNS